MPKKYKNTIGYLLIAVVALLLCIRYYYIGDCVSIETVQSHIDGDMILFSEDSGFYSGALSISLIKNRELPSSARIYFTLNGDDPAVGKREYTEPIQLKQSKDTMVYPIKAVVYYKEEYSDIYEKTYVLRGNEDNELNLSIVSISSDRENLYDYDTGILVPGITYDEEIAKGREGFIRGNYSNRDDEWIRNAHMAIFDSEGSLVVEQDIGLGVSGDSSAAADVKSLKVYAGYEYDENYDDFYIDLSTDEILSSVYSFVNKYNSIRLRCGSQDIEFGNIRSSVVSRLAQLSGSDGCTATKRCIVYLNGKFYGIFDMQQNYSNSYLANRFGLANSDCIEKYKGFEDVVFSEAGIGEYFRKDLDNAIYRGILEEYVDMDNYLLYYAINILCNNTDWPGNNFEIWRYTGESDESNRYSDNRYRFLIYDTDLMFNTESTPPYFPGCQGDTFVSLMENYYKAAGSSFSNVMNSVYYRNKFITIVTDLLNTSFSKDNIKKIIYEENEKIAAARKEYYNEEFVENAEFSVKQVVQAAENRPKEIEDSFSYYFGLNEKYELELKTSEGVSVMWNNMNLFADDVYHNQYYKDVEWTLNQETYPGYTFQYWQVNGEKVYGTSLTVTGNMICNDEISIQAIAAKDDACAVILSEVSARGTEDWMRFSNVGSYSANLNQYYISDDEKDLRKYQLPDIVLEEEESIVIYGSKNHVSIGDYVCNFSLSEDEILYLSDERGVLSVLTVPRMSNIETYGRYDNSNSWKFFKNSR